MLHESPDWLSDPQGDDDESVPPHLNEEEESESGWDEEDDIEESEEDILAQLEVSKRIFEEELIRKAWNED